MATPTLTTPAWSSKGLGRLLRATLSGRGEAGADATATDHDAREELLPPMPPLSSGQLRELAARWRLRENDESAETVARAFEMLAERRERPRVSQRAQAMRERISALMHL